MMSRWRARHTVLVILFVTWVISGVDRMAMSVAIPYISNDFHLSSLTTGVVMSAFYGGYAISQIPGGLLADKFGVRRIATLAMLWWSALTAVTGLTSNLGQMAVTRLVFGLGEGVFPACAFKTIAVWFPKRERATANAIMLTSNPLGIALSPLAVVAAMSLWGWRAAFYCLFIPGVLIALLFWSFIRDRPSESNRVSREELAEIEIDDLAADHASEPEPGVFRALKRPNVINYAAVLFMFDIAYWGFTAWLPTYLVKVRGFSVTQMGIAASLPFLSGAIGALAGGPISDRYFRNSRRAPIILSQLLSALLLYLTFTAKSAPAMLFLQTLTGFFFMSFFSFFWALPMNTVPRKLMGVTSAFINMAGQIAAFLSPVLVGYLVDAAGGRFDHAIMLIVGSILASCALVFTLPMKLQYHPKGIIPGSARP